VKVAKQFMDLAYKQMGVHVFMLVGYKNSEGDAVRAKCVDCFSVLPIRHLIHFRLETDSSIPVRNQFTAIFDKFGDEVWDKWDEFLQNGEDQGQSST
jgi:hypothetical protein